MIVVADGYEPAAKLIEVTENSQHKTAPVLNFELSKVNSAAEPSSYEDQEAEPMPMYEDMMDFGSNSLDDYLNEQQPDLYNY